MSNQTVKARGAVGTLLLSAAIVTAAANPAHADSVEPGARTCFDVAGSPGDAAVVNLTPVGSLASGSGQLVSSDIAAPPVYSNVNFGPDTIDPNIAVSAIGTDGQTCFVNNSAAQTGIVADHLGTIDATAYTQATPSGAPARVVDTRTGLGGTRLAAGARLCFSVDGAPGDAAVVNLTPVRATGTGNGKLVSSDVAAPPVFSNVNYAVGSIDPNVAVATVGADGRVCFVNADLASVDLVADHMGTIDAAAYTQATPSGAPARVVDTRTGLGGTRLAAGARLCFSVDGAPGDAAVVNLTPVQASSRGNGQLVSSDVAAPPVYSNVNWDAGSIDPNVAIVEVGTDGRTCFVNNAPGSVDLIADHMGAIDAAAYTPASSTGAPVRSLDSRLTASRADLVLAPTSVGAASFGREDSDTIDYISSALGAPVFDESMTFSIDIGPFFQDGDTGLGFSFRESRDVCWDNNFCATFGGQTVAALVFVGWDQRDNNATAPLLASNGLTIGSRGSDFPDGFFVPTGGCFSFGFGESNGVRLGLVSDGIPFGEIGPGGTFISNTPPLSDVVVVSLDGGQSVFNPQADC